MAKKNNLYNEPINEFVDWVSGENTFTGQNITGGLKVSGGKIRELIQSKLKNPIYVEEDVANNVYRIFSSKIAYNLWAENPSDNADLQLFTIPRPSDYKLDITLSNNGDRYIKSGDNTSPLTRIQFFWRIYNDEGNASDGLTVTYTISNIDGSSNTFTRRYNNGVSEDFSIANYLKVGENQVTIEGRGNNTGARNSMSFNITVLDIQVQSGFNFAGNHSQGEPLRTPYTFYRNNVDGTAKIYFVIDDGGNGKTFSVDILSGGQTRIEDTGMMISPTLEAGQHTLQIYAEAIYNDGQVTIYSNLLYFTFVVASTEAGVTDKFINIATSFNSGNYPFSSLTLTTTQYYDTKMRWGYYTYAANTDTKIPVVWKLLEGADDANPTILATVNANTAYEASELEYVPIIYTDDEQLYLAAYFGQNELTRIPIYITQNDDLKNIYETSNYQLKMSAYGRTNDSSDKDTWTNDANTVSTTFTDIDWNPNSGWYNNSFRTIGLNQYATIGFQPFMKSDPSDLGFPFTYGKTIEIEFESEKVTHSDDKLIIIGNPVATRIEITPNTATLYDNDNNEVIHTNYKANERIKLAFIINKVSSGASATVDDGLAYIVNNGILERGALANGRSFETIGNIKIGGSTSGVRVYNLRIYDKSITYTDAYNNYVYDSNNKANIVNRNKILDQGVISYDLCKNKLDTILITGNLSELLRQGPNKTDADVMIERICPYDQSKDFIVGDLIDDPERANEKKIVNGVRIRKHGQSTLNYPITSLKFWLNKAKSGIVPIFSKTGQENLMLNKNRYKMKNSSIPANKFVLQANYADSSGVHNGGLLRLLQESWYNARIDGLYRLRTLPQLFSSIKSNEKASYGLESVWADYFPKNAFPYNIEIAADSFPCAVFYHDLEGTKKNTFLGQYVFMEDKKSDYCYGERSIYKIAADPFCLTVAHKNEDTSNNRIWDNSNVLRIEVLNVNDRYSSYETLDGFETFSGDKYGWEDSFELIYPDPDDVEEDDGAAGLSKSNPNSKFAQKTKPFVDWYKWLLSTRNNQAKFEAEAADHLDLYKLAAYYVFVLRFALVDSLERNAQIKTYDGVHFHYEPWDMDIALGNKNDGGIAYNPPVDRNTKLNISTYAISGRAADNNGNVVRSNWLWDALEAWPEWINVIVPKVADALYEAGLTYNNIITMLDENYANAWCEIMYNQSGHFKYVESAGGDLQRWLGWLQGARMSHRHWWLSTSMDYYDAKWFCGDYKNHAIYLAANITADANKSIEIIPNSSTFMTVTVNNQESSQEEVDTTRSVTPQNPLVYSMEKGASTKAPIHIYGANFMEKIDMRDIATGIDALDLTSIYSEVLGAPLKELRIGTHIEGSNDTYTTILSPSTCGVSPSQSGINAFENLELLDIRGHMHLGNVQQFSFGINQWMRDLDMSQLKNFYAMGSNLTNFYSSDSGNNFDTIELPSTVSVINIKNSTWNTLEFWDTTEGANDTATLTKHATPLTGGGFSNIPSTLREVHFLGSTGRTRESLLFIRAWLKSIVETEGTQALSNYTLEMDDVFWSQDVIGNNEDLLTYDELELISQMNGLPDQQGNKVHPIRGYVILKYEGAGTELTSAQLTQIRTWFGDTVFTKGSAGLVVDYMHNYIQINIGGQATMVNGEIYLKEGHTAMLSATQFLLAETQASSYVWGLWNAAESRTVPMVRGVTLLDAENTIDGNTYLVTSESMEGTDYDVEVRVTAGGHIYSATVHIIAAKYPAALTLNYSRYGNIDPRYNSNSIILWQNGIAANVFLDKCNDYTATVRSVVYRVTAPDGRTCTYSSKTGPSWEGDRYNIDERIYITEVKTALGFDDTYCIRFNCPSGVPNNNNVYQYDVQVIVTFNSDKQMTVDGRVVVMNDSVAIVSRLQELLYAAIAGAWQTQYGEQLDKNSLYRADLLGLNGQITFGPSAQLDNVITYSGTSSVIKHLPAITSLIFDNNTNLTSTYNTITEDNGKQLVFTNTPDLQKLYIQNCTSLNQDIDLTMCHDIREVDASGTSINVLVPENAPLTKYEVGTPTSISLINPTVLTPAGVVVDSYGNLDSLDLVNIPNNKSFAVFEKITQNYILGGFLIGPGKWISDDGTLQTSNDQNAFISNRISVIPGHSVTLQSSGSNAKLFIFSSEDQKIGDIYVSRGNSNTRTLSQSANYIIITIFRQASITLTDNTSNTILFKRIAS